MDRYCRPYYDPYYDPWCYDPCYPYARNSYRFDPCAGMTNICNESQVNEMETR